MTQIATVEERLGPGLVRIAVRRGTACGHDCEHCGGCAAAGGQIFLVTAADPLNTCPGDRVLVESSTGQVLSAAALVYLFPLAGLIAGYALSGGGTPIFQGMVTAAGFGAGLLPALWLDRQARRRRESAFRVLERL